MKNYPIKKFWTKLMVASRAINTIPDEYLELAQNVRIYDGGIWARPGKQILVNSPLWTNNKGGFTMNSKLFQITNSKIYEINVDTGVQTEKATLGYDAFTDVLVYGTNIAIITSPWQAPKLYDGVTTVSTITTVPAGNTGIVEYCRNFSFITKDNILYISRPITATNPEFAYDWTGAGSQNITYDSKIIGLKGTMNGLYVFLENKVEYLGANSLQNVSWSATFISTPLGEGAAPISNTCIAASGDKIFYISRNLKIQTVNFIQWASNPSIWELSARPVVGIKDLLLQVSTVQPTAFAYFNENFNIIEFHCRTTGSLFNDRVIIYDMINDTWSIDTWKNYNYIVKYGFDYYGFSDINSSIYKNDVGFSDNWTPIDTIIRTSGYNAGSILHKIFGWFYTSGAIWFLTELEYNISVDWESIFTDIVTGLETWVELSEEIATEDWEFILTEDWESLMTETQIVDIPLSIFSWIGDLSGTELSGEPVGGYLSYESQRKVFDRIADIWRIYYSGKRIAIEIKSSSQIQDFIVDMIWFAYEPSNFTDIPDKF